MDKYFKLNRCLDIIRKETDFVPRVGIILGSGLGALADEIEVRASINYSDIEGFPISTVAGHKGRFVFGYIDHVPVVIMQGRVHYYEGYSMEEVVLPTRLMRLMGAEIIMLTNAAGGVNFNFKSGDFMIIEDHISTFVNSPLVGANIDEMGLRFPDMSMVYDKNLNSIIEQTASDLGIDIKRGVYMQLSGPNFETPAEVRMCRTLGADAVGMSTACEAMAAKHCGFKVCGISCISNLACGMTDSPLTHEEVQQTADRVAVLFKKLITNSVAKFGDI